MIEVAIFTVVVAHPEAPSVVVLAEKEAVSGVLDALEAMGTPGALGSNTVAGQPEQSRNQGSGSSPMNIDQPHLLPIWIGHSEAEAILHLLEGQPHARPLTHDLLASVIGSLGSKVEYVVIDRVVGSTFFASIRLNKDGRFVTIDARPSDSIALALRTEARIFVDEDVMNAAARQFSIKVSDGGELLYGSEDEMARFRDFIESVSPEDFSV